MIKNTDTLMEFFFQKDNENGKLFVTINNDKNEDNSLVASAFDINYEKIAEAVSSDRNQVGYILQDRLEELGYERDEFRISKSTDVIVDLIFKQQQERKGS